MLLEIERIETADACVYCLSSRQLWCLLQLWLLLSGANAPKKSERWISRGWLKKRDNQSFVYSRGIDRVWMLSAFGESKSDQDLILVLILLLL